MNNDLPEMYKNNISKELNNNRKIYSSLDNDDIRNNTTYSKKKYSKYEIENKINNIFNAKDFIYKASVIVQLNNEVLNIDIIGKKDNYLITMDNDYINIDDINDIYRK